MISSLQTDVNTRSKLGWLVIIMSCNIQPCCYSSAKKKKTAFNYAVHEQILRSIRANIQLTPMTLWTSFLQQVYFLHKSRCWASSEELGNICSEVMWAELWSFIRHQNKPWAIIPSKASEMKRRNHSCTSLVSSFEGSELETETKRHEQQKNKKKKKHISNWYNSWSQLASLKQDQVITLW